MLMDPFHEQTYYSLFGPMGPMGPIEPNMIIIKYCTVLYRIAPDSERNTTQRRTGKEPADPAVRFPSPLEWGLSSPWAEAWAQALHGPAGPYKVLKGPIGP